MIATLLMRMMLPIMMAVITTMSLMMTILVAPMIAVKAMMMRCYLPLMTMTTTVMLMLVSWNYHHLPLLLLHLLMVWKITLIKQMQQLVRQHNRDDCIPLHILMVAYLSLTRKNPSKLQSLITDMSKVEQKHKQQHNTQTPKKRVQFQPSKARARYFISTTFMPHSTNCGGHNQDIESPKTFTLAQTSSYFMHDHTIFITEKNPTTTEQQQQE